MAGGTVLVACAGLAACSGPPGGSSSGGPSASASRSLGGLPPAAAARAARGAVGRAVGGQITFAVVGGSGGGFVVGGLPAGSGTGGRPQITVGPIPPAGAATAITLPLKIYGDVATLQQTVLTEASTLLTQKCMADRGFVYAQQAAPSQEQQLLTDTEYGYGVSSAADASSYGYGQPSSASGGPQAGPAFLGGFASFGDLAKQPRAWVVALLGFAPGARVGPSTSAGCLNQASAELNGQSGSGLSDPVPGIAFQASSWTQSDPRVLAANSAWSGCMAARGYKYSNPQAAANAGWPSHPAAAETATASADVSCKQQVNYVNIWLAVEAAYQSALIAKDAPTLAHLQQRFTSMLRQAENLLSLPALPAIKLARGLHRGITLVPVSP